MGLKAWRQPTPVAVSALDKVAPISPHRTENSAGHIFTFKRGALPELVEAFMMSLWRHRVVQP